MLDELSLFFRKNFTADELMERTAQNMLHCCASQLDFDIATIETRHASVRRVSTMKSVQTWAMALEDLGAEFVTRQQCILRGSFSGPITVKHERRKKKHKARKSRGGPWRAFLHQKLEGKKFAGQVATEMLAAYKDLKRAGGPERQQIKELGLLMTEAGRRGVKVKAIAAHFKKRKGPGHSKSNLADWAALRIELQI